MLKAWINALRLKTLPLAIGAILIGSWLPKLSFKIEVFAMALCTAILLQILSNLANDYGDYVKGTDKHRKDRQLGGGHIKLGAMKIAIVFVVILALTSGIILLNFSFEGKTREWIVFLIIGLLCILAAIAYTVGKKAYGYYGLGDFFVLLFFGFVGVLGTAYLYQQAVRTEYFLAAFSYGSLCVAVLNVNNIRDLDKDILNNKITIAAKMGKEGALNYQGFLFIASFIAMGAHHLVASYFTLAPIGIALLGYNHMIQVRKAEQSDDYNAQLRNLSLGTLAIALLFIFKMHL